MRVYEQDGTTTISRVNEPLDHKDYIDTLRSDGLSQGDIQTILELPEEHRSLIIMGNVHWLLIEKDLDVATLADMDFEMLRFLCDFPHHIKALMQAAGKPIQAVLDIQNVERLQDITVAHDHIIPLLKDGVPLEFFLNCPDLDALPKGGVNTVLDQFIQESCGGKHYGCKTCSCWHHREANSNDVLMRIAQLFLTVLERYGFEVVYDLSPLTDVTVEQIIACPHFPSPFLQDAMPFYYRQEVLRCIAGKIVQLEDVRKKFLSSPLSLSQLRTGWGIDY